MSKITHYLTGIAAGAAITLLVTQPHNLNFGAKADNASAKPDATTAQVYQQLDLFGSVFERVRAEYVERPDDLKLIENAINGMLTGLDPHSSYLDAKEFRDMQVLTTGKFGGLGIEVTMENGVVKVIAPIDDTPAAKAGILANDLIVKIDDDQVHGLTLGQAVDKMRGIVNTKVNLTIIRKDHDGPIEITLTRDTIVVKLVRSNIESDDIGYIRISQFGGQATVGLKKAINDIATKVGDDKLKGYVLDLRNNPGGLLDEAISVSETFLPTGEVVSVRGRSPDDIKHFGVNPGGAGDVTHGKPIIVLINGGSASASEIVAGALQDNKRATIIGTRSFGKGSVQTIIPLGGTNGALRLTTARYYTPSGRTIQAKGITPDIEVLQDLPDDIKAKGDTSTKGEASLRGHLKVDGDTEQAGSQAYIPPDKKDDKALNTAKDLLHRVLVNSAFPPNVKVSVPN